MAWTGVGTLDALQILVPGAVPVAGLFHGLLHVGGSLLNAGRGTSAKLRSVRQIQCQGWQECQQRKSQRLPLPAAPQVVSSSARGQTHQAVPQAAWRLARAAWSCGCVQAGGCCAVTNLGLWSGIEELGLCNAQPGPAALEQAAPGEAGVVAV